MTEREKPDTRSTKEISQDAITDADTRTANQLALVPPRLRERIRHLLDSVQRSGPVTRRELARDRTRSLGLLLGGTIAALLLFIAIFSTPAAQPRQETNRRASPNLGRATAQPQGSGPRSSVIPLLNADVASDDGNSDQLSPADIQNTSRGTSPDETSLSPQIGIAAQSHAPITLVRSAEGAAAYSNVGSRSLTAYRVHNPRTLADSDPEPPPSGGPLSQTQGYGGAVPIPVESGPHGPSSGKSLFVFLRSPESAGGASGTRSAVTASFEETSLLPPGTRLAARLEAAATTAFKAPVIASIEYNYERDGTIMVPAGTKVFGDVQQASSEGYLNIRFHTLRMPRGREEKIEATGVSLDYQPLKGQVSGKNTGKKLISQTLSGVGTVAAYVVGAGGAGLSQAVTGETLLRNRLASNVALAGEQELTNAAFSQNVIVTVPANTRFYVVLEKPAVATTPPRSAEPPVQAVMPTVQELRELMDLRREINRMYQESDSTSKK